MGTTVKYYPPINWQAPVANAAALPSDAIEGAARVVLDTGEIYVYISGAWAIAPATPVGGTLTEGSIYYGAPGDVAAAADTAAQGDIAATSAGLNIKSGVIVNGDISASAAIAFSKLAALTAERALQTSAGGLIEASAVTSTELGYLDGVTSAIQTQLNTLDSRADAQEQLHVDVAYPIGFVDPDNWVVSYDHTTRAVTLTPTGTQAFYKDGVKYELSSPLSVVHDATTANYFIIMNGTLDGLVSSTTPFDIANDVLVAFVRYDSVLGSGYCIREVHDARRNPVTQLELHNQIGTYRVSGGTVSGLTGYTPADVTNPALATIQPDISAAVVADEELWTSLSGFAQDGIVVYTKFRKLHTTNKWVWDVTDVDAPYFQSANVAQYNPSSGGDSLVNMTDDAYINYYLFAIPASAGTLSQQVRFFWVPGQAQYVPTLPTTAARTVARDNALAEDWRSLDLTGLPASEFVPLQKLVLHYNTAYTNNAYRLRVEGSQAITGSRAQSLSLSTVSPTAHNNLSGLQGGTAGEYFHLTAAESVYNTGVSSATFAGQLDSSVETTLALALGRLDDFGYVPPWATSTTYRVGNVVKVDSKLFYCGSAHTSGTFDTDLTANGYWHMIGNGGLAGSVTTTNATPTTILSSAVPSNVACIADVRVSCQQATTNVSRVWDIKYHITNKGGTVTSTVIHEIGNAESGSGAWAVTTSGTSNFTLQVTGEVSANSIEWHATCEFSYF